jgi:hypothetical protein
MTTLLTVLVTVASSSVTSPAAFVNILFLFLIA